MRYPITLSPEEKGMFTVTFPDIPEAITCGNNREDALDMGLDALITALDFYFEDKRSVPRPSTIHAGDDFVELPASVAAKVLLLNEMLAAQLKPLELARRMGTTERRVNRMLDLHRPTRIDSVAAALRATGKSLELSAV